MGLSCWFRLLHHSDHQKNSRVSGGLNRVAKKTVRASRLALTAIQDSKVRGKLRSHHRRIVDRGYRRSGVPLIIRGIV